MFKIVEYTNVQIIHVRQKLRLQAADSLIFFFLFLFCFGGFFGPLDLHDVSKSGCP